MSNEIKRYASEDCVDSKINSAFEKHNTFTIEYAEPIKISLADIPIFNKVISNGTATYGTVEIVDGQTFIYTPTTYLLGAETVVLTFDDNTTYDVYINPADNIYYDASFFNIADATGWLYVEDETGSYAVATVDTGTNQLVPHFVGTGFALYGKYSLDDGALCSLLVERANNGSTLARSATNSFNGYNVPVYEKVISEHDTWDVRIVRNKTNTEGAKLELSGIRIYNTIYDESSPSFTSVAEKVKKSNSDTNGTATSVIYLAYNTETKAFDRTLFDSAISNSQVYHAFEINKTGGSPKIWVSANAQPNKSTLSSVDSYNDNIAVSHSKSIHLDDGVMKFVPLETVNYNGKNYVLISSPTGITALGAIKCVDCEIVTQADQAAVNAFVEDVIRIANGTLIATMKTTKQLEEAIADLAVTPQMYGAVGDGTTDDTDAFRRALAENDTIYVPNAEYLITDTLDISYRKSLYSDDGQRATILYNGDNSVISLGRMSVFRNINITVQNAFEGIIFETNNQKINTGEPGLHTRVEHVVVDFEQDCSATLIGLIADSGTDPNDEPRLSGFCFQTYQDIHVDNSSKAYRYGIKFETIQGRDFETSTSSGYPWINHIDFKDISLAHPHTAIKSVSTVADGLVSQDFGFGHIMFDNVYSQTYHKKADNRYELTRYFLDLENFGGYFTRCMPWDYHYFAWGQGIADPDPIIHIIGKNVTACVTDGTLCTGSTELVRLCRFTAEEDSGKNAVDNPEYFITKYFPGSVLREGYDSVDAKIDTKLSGEYVARISEEKVNEILYSGYSNVLDDPLTQIKYRQRWSGSSNKWVEQTLGCHITTVIIPIVQGGNIIRWSSPNVGNPKNDYPSLYFFNDDNLTDIVGKAGTYAEMWNSNGSYLLVNNPNGYKYVSIPFCTSYFDESELETMVMTINREITSGNGKSYTEYLKENTIDPTVSAKVTEELKKISIPQNTSDLVNDSGFLTQHQDISGKANKSDAETWTFTLSDGTTVTKRVVLA